tara:strand:- start:6466 stop:9369 length:2904 start_codon:yes stop_codon:yes gene_type:complete
MITVIKRDHTEEQFDITKISNAIKKALDNPKDKTDLIQIIIKDIENIILSRQAPFTIHIEDIQDIVEKSLMEHKLLDEAKKYILYRKERNDRRNIEGYDLYKIKDNIEPAFGSSFGYVVFKRTYARKMVGNGKSGDDKTEEFSDTIIRILNGCQKQLKCGFTEKELKRAFRYMIDFKGLPAGRFLWQLSTSTVDRLGLMSLQNCAFVVCDDINSFLWIFDNLMLGVGCGVNIQKKNINKLPPITKNYIKITQNLNKDADFIVPDSREGWVEVLKKVLEAFFVSGKGFSYSTLLVRHKGEPIRGFGGTSSGPEPLCEGIKNICKILNNRLGRNLTSVDVLDVCNIIGQIVCSGNIRRSAQIMLGDIDDIDYIKCKDWNTGTIPNWRSMSNNSIICNDINDLPEEYWNTFLNDSEVFGLININLAKKVGRIKDGTKYPDVTVEGCNPCFSADTMIGVADGRGTVSIKELAEDGSDVPVYSLNTDTGMIEIKMGRHPRITGYNKKMVKITLDNDTSLTTTIDHKFILNDGKIVHAKDLVCGMSLPRFNKELITFSNETKITNTDLETIYIDGELSVKKVCENCKEKFVVPYNKREICYCSKLCSNTSSKVIDIDIDGRDTICKKDITVKNIEFVEETETVYNITVDDNHTVAIITNNEGNMQYDGILVYQCGEQMLENTETCCLSELFLCNMKNYEELKDVATIMYRICKHSMTLPCHHDNTNKVVHKNMRMGIGITGYMQSTEEQKGWLSDLYEYLREYDNEYSIKHGFPISIKITTCKPSGTMSSMGGEVTPGCHPAIFKHYIRRMRVSSDSPLIPLCKKNGYKTEYAHRFDGTDDKNTMIIEFPCKFPDHAILAKDVDCIKQLEVVKRIQNEWSDNAVSVTVYYKKEDVPRIRKWLKENYNNCIKSVSFLLHYEHAFDQAPYEEITEDQYNQLIKNTKNIIGKADMNTIEETVDMGGECVSGVCSIR